MTTQQPMQVQIWPIDRLVFYSRNPRKNDAAVDRMLASIQEFGFKIPVSRSHFRNSAASKRADAGEPHGPINPPASAKRSSRAGYTNICVKPYRQAARIVSGESARSTEICAARRMSSFRFPNTFSAASDTIFALSERSLGATIRRQSSCSSLSREPNTSSVS